MNSSGAQRIVPIVLIIIIIAVAVAAVFSLGKNIFGGGGSPQPSTNTAETALLNTTSGSSVRLTVRGPIVGDNVFHSYQITIMPDSRNLTTYQGYLDSQIDTMQLSNNTQAYEQFVHALDRTGLPKGVEFTGAADDRRGVCASGTLYVYEILQGGNAVQTLWTTTCSGSPGSLTASNDTLSSLFRAQVPNWRDLVSKINM